jgi:membrane protein YdbS with pleckstrin-like domain
VLISLIVTAPVIPLVGWIGLALFPGVLAWTMFASWHQVRRMAWAVTGEVVAFKSGWLWRHVTVTPIVRIQSVDCVESPFDRRAGMARVRVDTAGASELAHRVDVPYLPQETARDLFQRLAAGAAHTVLRW